MKFLLKNIRSLLLLFSFFLSIGIYLYVRQDFPGGDVQIIQCTQIYALTALVFLYVTLLATPLTEAFPSLPLRGVYILARKSLGVSAFYFAFLHFLFAFFGELGGFPGLLFLDNQYLVAISLSFTALIILTLLAATSFNFMVAKLGSAWKKLHRFVYLAGILILIHVFMIGSHFTDLSGVIPQLFFVAMAFLFILEALRIDRYFQRKFVSAPRFGVMLLIVMVSLGAITLFNLVPTDTSSFFNIHAFHIQLAKEAQNGTSVSDNFSNVPGLSGDKTRRFTVSFLHPEKVIPGEETTLRFQVFDANSGNQTGAFEKIYEQYLHLVIVDSQLQYFQHVHPTLDGKDFVITFQFPKDGVYHLYLDFQPLGAIEQQFAFTLPVGQNPVSISSTQPPDQNFTKNFGAYDVSLEAPTPLQASLMAVGAQRITFTLRDAKTHQPITNLKPYLGAFGHLVMINEQTFEYIHVHPTNLYPPKPDANGGPEVEFTPLGLYGPIKPGVYRVFAQFNPDGKLMVADFTLNIEP